MKGNVRLVATVAALISLVASDAPIALGQTGASGETSPSHPSYVRYAELANAPEKARASATRLPATRMLLPQEESFLRNIVRNAME